MKVTSEAVNSVAFLCTEDEVSPGVHELVPHATAFFVLVPGEGPKLHSYVVTAGHCIDETRGLPFVVRLSAPDRFIDEPTRADLWFEHDDADVALTPFVPQVGERHGGISAIDLTSFVAADYTYDIGQMLPAPGVGGPVPLPVEVGDEVAFAGLFSAHPGSTRNLPVVRFGHISQMPSEPVSFERADGTATKHLAYLAECRSWGGHSGSPVFWHSPSARFVETDIRTGMIKHAAQGVTALLGLVSGHFDIEKAAKVEGDILGSVTAQINAGMALVTPAERIRELLMRDDVVNERKDREK
jgi:hypothetical protein